MPTVMHGRRRGQSKEAAPALPPQMESDLAMMSAAGVGNHSAPPGVFRNGMPNMEDLRKVTILSKGDWDRIQWQLNKRTIEKEQLRQAREEKDRQKELAKNHTKNWANTVAGSRQKRLEALKIREEKEEEERKLVDIEESKFQAIKRKEAIERAKTQQYYQTDRVKGFHGALLLTEVLKEREAQLELNQLKDVALTNKDNEWLQKAQRDYEHGILRDQKEASKRINNARKTSSFLNQQMQEHQRGIDYEQKEDLLEGDELKKLAAQYSMERTRLENIRKQEATTLMSDNRRQIDDVKTMRLIHQQQAEEEDEECRIFAAAKRKMMKLRAEKERQLHNEKQERLEQIRQKLNAQLQQKMDDEDDRILRAQEEAEVKRVAEEETKEEGNMRMQKEMVEHRHAQMAEHTRQEKEERLKEHEMLAVRKQADAQFQLNEAEKVGRHHQELKHLQGYHVNQIKELKSLEEAARQEQLAQDMKNEDLIRLEEDQFQEYAGKVIAHCRKGGRNAYPLQKAARDGAGGGLGPVFPGKGGVRPSYMVCDQTGVQMPNYQRGTTDDVKQNIYSGHSSKRLGFVW